MNLELDPEQIERLESVVEEALESEDPEDPAAREELESLRRRLEKASHPDAPHVWYRLQ